MSTFLSSFEGHWRRPSADYQQAVRSYRISVDTNVILELYRFTPKAREELLVVLRHLRNRLWIPHQVAKEYYGRRISAVKEHLALYDSVPDSLEEQKKKAIQELNTFSKRCSISHAEREKLTKPIEQAFQQVSAEIGRHRDAFDLTLERVIDSDPVLAALGEIFDERTGAEFDEQEAARHLIEFQRRVTERIPPGYKDSGKAQNAHGDFFVWEQLLSESSRDSRPLLFVTNDAKDDWVRKEAGLLVGARPELVAEFEERCKADFLILQLGRFLQIAKEELGVFVSESTLAQAENSVQHYLPRPSESFILSQESFSGLLDVLHSEARMNGENISELSVEERRDSRRRSRKAGVIMDNMKYSAQSRGGRVRFRLDATEWETAYQIWRKSRVRGDEIDLQGIPAARDLQAQIQALEDGLRVSKAGTDGVTADARQTQQRQGSLRHESEEISPRWSSNTQDDLK